MEKFRIQPKEIEIPEENPFKNDRLGRRKLIESLTNLVGAIEGPCVIAVDAPWGAGKTTFLRMWSQHLRNQKFPVVEFNAWDTDFSNDPFVALCAELTGSIDAGESNELDGKINEVKEKGQVVLRHFVSNAVKQVTLGIVDYNAVKADLDKQPEEPHIQQRMDEYQETQAALGEFRHVLKDMAAELPGSRPLMVMIDELDRCRPTYAVELLETTKHLFSVDQVVFVLAVNRDQLAHAVRALYGNDTKADIYLRRFFDQDLRLPQPDLDKYIDGLFVSVGIVEDGWFQKLLKTFFCSSRHTLRDIAQAFHRYGVVLNSLPDTRNPIARMTTITLILRTLDEKLYHRFAEGDVPDNEMADSIFNISSLTPLRWEDEGIWFQTGIWLAYKELKNNRQTVLETRVEEHINAEEDIMTQDRLENAQSIALQTLQDRYTETPVFQRAYEHTELMFSLTDETSK